MRLPLWILPPPKTKNASIKKRDKRRAAPAFEQLEDRVVLTNDYLTLEQVLARFDGNEIAGATIITHGFQLGNEDGDSLMPLAQAIRDRSATLEGFDGWLIDYDVTGEGGYGVYDAAQSILPQLGETGRSGDRNDRNGCFPGPILYWRSTH